jgi:glycyl-tRNA synthetase beta chain
LELLFEIGTEEIPPSYMRPALKDLASGVEASLKSAGIAFSDIRTMGTPRRMVLVISRLAEKAEDKHVTVFGPPADKAFDQAGKPTQAAIGFAGSQGVDVRDLKTAKKGKSDYVCIDKVEPGAVTRDTMGLILRTELGGGGIRFPKTMKWEAEGARFARPVRWLTYVIDGRLGTDSRGEQFTWAGLTAGDTTRGHLFLGKRKIKVTSAEQYFEDLERNFVIVDHERRRRMIEERISEAAREVGGSIVEDEDLLERVTFTVEYPLAMLGAFSPKFLEMPKEVVVTALREHQEFFSVAGRDGGLTPHFVAVANMDKDREGKIREGNERVLKARLDDAHFYWEKDLREGLDTMASRLTGVVWQEQLGTLAEKSWRVGRLAEHLVKTSGVGETAKVRRGALVFKADLTSEMVREKEFSSLQGLMGREYALAAGEDTEVAAAIFEHYLPRFAADKLPETPTGQILALADKLDSIVGCFGVGLVPTGSEDPYALRRQAAGVVRILIEKGIHLDLEQAVTDALDVYGDKIGGDRIRLVTDVYLFLEQRLQTLLVGGGNRPDVVESVLGGAGVKDPLLMVKKLEAIRRFQDDDRFGTLTTVFKRAWNIFASAGKAPGTGGDPDASLFESQAEAHLLTVYRNTQAEFRRLIGAQDFHDGMAVLLELAGPINVFFDEVMVMADDEKLRENRLNLLGRITDLFLEIADFSKMDVS